jgi:hypothetical protein
MLMQAGDDDLVTPDWALDYVDPTTGSVVSTTIIASDDYLGGQGLPAGLHVAVSGDVIPRSPANKPSYIYFLQIGADDTVAQLYPAPGAAADLEDVGTALRLPRDAGGLFTLPMDGRVRVVETAETVEPSQWAEILRGRDPLPAPSTTKNS